MESGLLGRLHIRRAGRRPRSPMTLHFQSVTVLGAGTMGHGIAHVCAMAGIDTVLYDVDLGAVDTGLRLIRANLDTTVSLGKLTKPERDEILSRIQRSSDLAFAVQGAQLIIEAAPESMDIKRGLFRLLEQRVGWVESPPRIESGFGMDLTP